MTADDLAKRVPSDSDVIDLGEPAQIDYWCGHFGCTEEALRRAVRWVGPSAFRVHEHLNHPDPLRLLLARHRIPMRELVRRMRAARRLRRELIHIPWYKRRDTESGMRFWLDYHGSQVMTD